MRLEEGLGQDFKGPLSPNSHCCSVTKSWPTLCAPMDCSTPSFPILHYLLECAQTHVHWGSDAIQPSHPLSLSSSLALSLSQHWALFPVNWLFTSGGTSVSASVLPKNIQGWFPLGLISLLPKGCSRVFSNTTIRKHQSFSAQPSFWSSCHIRTSKSCSVVSDCLWPRGL